MTIEIRNKALHKRIMKRIKIAEDKAMKYYKEGNMEDGERYEKQADALYKINYTRMFKVRKRKDGGYELDN